MSQLGIITSFVAFSVSWNIKHHRESRLIQLLTLEHELQITAILEKLNHVKVDGRHWAKLRARSLYLRNCKTTDEEMNEEISELHRKNLTTASQT